ncbi:MAG: hypothetical protein LQ346_007306 [Caloplaca aetnensis]|nr:MAG: hypothetical protein LQ346_007306 [Caloplaca aetnensis]
MAYRGADPRAKALAYQIPLDLEDDDYGYSSRYVLLDDHQDYSDYTVTPGYYSPRRAHQDHSDYASSPDYPSQRRAPQDYSHNTHPSDYRSQRRAPQDYSDYTPSPEYRTQRRVPHDYPDDKPSPEYRSQRTAKPPAQGGKGHLGKGSAGKLAARAPDLAANLIGPTRREVAVTDLKTDHPKYRYIKDQEYKLVKNIGVGGQGHCDLYKNVHDGKYLVCKIMKHGTHEAGGSRPKEIDILMDILDGHPFVIHVKAYYLTKSLTMIWYEYCANGDLQDLIDAYRRHNARVPESFIWHAYKQLSEVFAYIHTGYDRQSGRRPKNFKPIVHRDVKPPNIFLRPNSNSKYPDLVLADFGIATTKLRSCEEVCMGTPAWQPYEIPVHSAEGDIWSLGACVHALATKSPPIKMRRKGFTEEDWECEPDARNRADLRDFGYSSGLNEALCLTLRTDPRDRMKGKELVDEVRRRHGRWDGKAVELASWALRK